MSPSQTPQWTALSKTAQRLRDVPLSELLEQPDRGQKMSHALAGCLFDFSKQKVDAPALQQLLALADARQVLPKAQAMFAGETVNTSENRAVLHSALRQGAPNAPAEVRKAVEDVKKRMYALAREVRDGVRRGYTGRVFTDVVHIGIGGSHLGPELVVKALKQHQSTPLRFHFLANIDANEFVEVTENLNPETTLFVVVSKSFSTLETQINAQSARSWFIERTADSRAIGQHFIGVTTNLDAAFAFGLLEENLYPIWDWVGGRFSLWSAVGMPILLALGETKFEDFLAGAQEVDEHFINTPAADNVPLLSALFATWNTNFLGASSLAVLPYDERLNLLPDYLQQLEMESNGKSVTLDGTPVQHHTMSVLWGGTGTKGQHAYHQLLHQGTRGYAADFIVVGLDEQQKSEHHNWLLANAFAQSQAMAVGFAAQADEPHRQVAGNHPTSTIVLDELAPQQLGALLAVYEHKVFCQGAIWNINSFDQWGVELGKALAKPIYTELSGSSDDGTEQDAATRHLINYIKRLKSNL